MAGKTSSSSTDLVLVGKDDPRFEILAAEQGGDDDVQAIIRDNFGDEGISPADLDRVKMPSGGGTAWEVPTLDGDESMKTLEGVIVAWAPPRVMWTIPLDDQKGDPEPPDCSSDDGKVGNGLYGIGSEHHPTGDCTTCPMNEWGSAGEDRAGKKCKETRLLYVLLEGGLLPITVSLPPTSIQPLRKYFLRLASSRVPFYGVVTKLALKRVDGQGAIKYAVVEPTVGDRLTPELRAAAKAYGETFTAAVSRSGVGQSSVAADEYARGDQAE